MKWHGCLGIALPLPSSISGARRAGTASSLVTALRSMGPASCLGNRVELVLMVKVVVRYPRVCESRRAVSDPHRLQHLGE